MPFDENIQPDVQDVLDAAAILDITEYDLFRLAYRRWHGDPAEDETMEPFFVAYMFGESVPAWVRHFARLVKRDHGLDQLDRTELGVADLPRDERMVRSGVRYSVALVTVMAVLLVLAEYAAQILSLGQRCMFPPCY